MCILSWNLLKYDFRSERNLSSGQVSQLPWLKGDINNWLVQSITFIFWMKIRILGKKANLSGRVNSNEEGWESYFSVATVRAIVVFLGLFVVSHLKNVTKLYFYTVYRHIVRGHTVSLASPSENSLPRKLVTATKNPFCPGNDMFQDSLL